jgi:transposase
MNRKSSNVFVGMDLHKDSIDISVAEGAGEVRHYARIGGEMNALWRAVRKLESLGRPLVLVYEAGPCGFGIYRMLKARGHECGVVAPSNTPRAEITCVSGEVRRARLGRTSSSRARDSCDFASVSGQRSVVPGQIL